MGDKTKPKKGKKKVVIIVLVVLVVVAAIIGSSVKKMTSQVATAVNTVEVEPVQKRDLSDTISLKGTVSGITKNNATSKALAEITCSGRRYCKRGRCIMYIRFLYDSGSDCGSRKKYV